eukprot:14013867-Ditylum_brightwellii.AAC.2
MMRAKSGYAGLQLIRHGTIFEPTSQMRTGYFANNVSHEMHTQLAIMQLAAATEEDCSTVSNLLEANSQLVDQVANMARQMDHKDEAITELCKNIQQLNVTIQALVN